MGFGLAADQRWTCCMNTCGIGMRDVHIGLCERHFINILFDPTVIDTFKPQMKEKAPRYSGYVLRLHTSEPSRVDGQDLWTS